MPDPFWKTTASDRSINPNPPIGAAVVKSFASGRVLDFGCGVGRLASEFDAYLGVDIAEHRIAEAQRRHPTKEFLLIHSPEDLRGMEFGTAIFDNVLIHVDDAEVVSLLRTICSIVPRVVIAEHLGREWRGQRHQWHRDLKDYTALFGNSDFNLTRLNLVMNPRYGKPMSILLWERD